MGDEDFLNKVKMQYILRVQQDLGESLDVPRKGRHRHNVDELVQQIGLNLV